MKIFSARQIYKADTLTLKRQQITSDALMERAALQLFNWIDQRLSGAQTKIHLFCGTGNNGGDGMALARHLKDHGYDSEVHVVNYSDKRSSDFLINLDRLKARKVWPNFINASSPFPDVSAEDIIVDAIFGIGLNRPPDAWLASLIVKINSSGAFILSVDVPSGLYSDKGPDDAGAAIHADYVLTFQAPKLIFFLPETGVYAEEWEVLDIGLDPEYLRDTETRYILIEKREALEAYIPRSKYSHKGTYGHVLVIGGSYGKIGAVILSSRAALHTGCGLVTAFIPSCGYGPMQAALPEAMVITDRDERMISEIKVGIDPTVIAIGMGIGQGAKTLKAFSDYLETCKKPLVIDADGLNMLAGRKSLLKMLPSQTVLTPHPKELERLIGPWKDDFEKLEKTRKFSNKYDCIVVVKGAHTITIYKDKGYVNSTGNPGMATAGSGDVLTGMIAALRAEGYAPLQAAIFGVYLHGRAGDLAAETTGQHALTASSIVAAIGSAFKDLYVPLTPGREETEGID